VIFRCSQTKLCLLPHGQYNIRVCRAGGWRVWEVREAASSTSLVKGTVTEEENSYFQ